MEWWLWFNGWHTFYAADPGLPLCECGRFLSSLRRAPLLAQIGFFAIFGAVAAAAVIGAIGLFLFRRTRGGRSLAALLAGLALLSWIGGHAVAYRLADCEPAAYYGRCFIAR